MTQGLKNVITGMWLAMVFVACICASSQASQYDSNPSNSARSLGMGNAGINSERGPTSTFYNPANIAAKTTAPVFQLLNVSLDPNTGLVTQGGREGYGKMLVTNFGNMYSAANNNKGNYAAGRASVYPNITMRNFSVGLLYSIDRGMMVRNTDQMLYVRTRDRFAPTAALSFRLFSGVLRIGAMVQHMTIGYADSYVNATNKTTRSWDKQMSAHSAITKTAGVTLTLPMRYLPSFSAVVRDIGNTNYTGSPLMVTGSSANSIPTQPMTVDLATCWTYYLANQLEFRLEGDYRDATYAVHGSVMQRVFAGGELQFFNMVSLRAGYMNGFPTAGLGVGTGKARINMAWYSDDIETRFRGFQDQRFVLQYTQSLIGEDEK